MSDTLTIEAPAKLNLSLRVLRRRDDGFHEIESLMVRLPGLVDRLEFRRADEDAFRCDRDDVPADASNLVIRARDLFRRETGRDDPVRIELAKRIPHGAGLGGGSSDAAATLRALDAMCGTGLPGGRLMELGAEIGSDVPFFLGGPAARVGGRGERIEAAEAVPMEVLLLKPSFAVATADAYGRWRESVELPGVPYGRQRVGPVELVNDLERPVFSKHLFLAELKCWLLEQAGVRAAMMSGSGSTVFAVLDSGDIAVGIAGRAREALDPTLWWWAGSLEG